MMFLGVQVFFNPCSIYVNVKKNVIESTNAPYTEQTGAGRRLAGAKSMQSEEQARTIQQEEEQAVGSRAGRGADKWRKAGRGS